MSTKCIVAKRLSGPDTVGIVGGVGRGMGVLDGVVIVDRNGQFGVNLGRLIVTNEDFATRLFPNYFGQDLLSVYRATLFSVICERNSCYCFFFAYVYCLSVFVPFLQSLF